MAFMDKKEQVIKVEMTPYGRYLYSTGRFKPSHYEFYDDDIIYDKRYADGGHRQEIFRELQNEVIPRIKRTPTNDLQTVFSSVDNGDLFTSDMALDQMHCRDNIEMAPQFLKASQLLNDAEYSMGLPLGTAENGNKNAPSWKVNLLKGRVEKFNVFLQAPKNRPPSQFRIPQLDVEIDIDVYNYTSMDGQRIITMKPDMLIAEIDEQNATDGIENEYELEVYFSDEYNLVKDDTTFDLPTGAQFTLTLTGTYEDVGLGASGLPLIKFYNTYGTPGNVFSKKAAAGQIANKILGTTGSMLTLSAKNAAVKGKASKAVVSNFDDVGGSFITLTTSEGDTERYYVISNLVAQKLEHLGVHFDFFLCADEDDDIARVCASGFGYSEVLNGYYFFEGADIEDATRNLTNAINASAIGGQKNFFATHTISRTGTDGSSTWVGLTGSIVVNTMRVGTSHYGTANPNNATVAFNNMVGIKQIHGVTKVFSGAKDTPTALAATRTNDQTKLLNEVLTNINRQAPGFVHLGNKDTILEENLKAYKDVLPFLFDSEDHSVKKFYFSDKPEAEKSDKFVNYYFDVQADSGIDKSDFCEARIFDQEKSLYVSGYIDCVKPELQSIDIYDQTDEDFGEPC